MKRSRGYRIIAKFLLLVIFVNVLPVYGSDIRGSGQEIPQGKKTYYIYSFDNKLLAEYDQDGRCLREYIYAGNLLVAEYRPQSDKYFYFTNDQINSTRVVTDGSGNVVSSTTYSPYGKKIQSTQTIDEAPKPQFSGKEREQATSNDYFGARYYDHSTYRFNSTDPVINKKEALLDPQRWNLYSYCRNNPITYLDPDGRRETPHSRFLSSMYLRNLEEANGDHARAFGSFMYRANSSFGGALGGATFLAVFHAPLIWAAVSAVMGPGFSNACQKVEFPFGKSSQVNHIFRTAKGHFDDINKVLMHYWARIFQNVASNPKYKDVGGITLDPRAREAGVERFYKMISKTEQIWVEVYNNVISNAGINMGDQIRKVN